MSKKEKTIHGLRRRLSGAAFYVNIVVALMLLASGYSDRINPAQHPVAGLVGLAFPVVAIANAMFLAWWTLFGWRRLWLPLAAFLMCYGPMWRYCPLNRTTDAATADGLKIFSYNVGEAKLPPKSEELISYLANAKADIICLQESGFNYRMRQRIYQSVENQCPYHADYMTNDFITILSRYPIVQVDTIRIPSVTNSACAFQLKIGRDTTCVVVCHLETTGLNRADKARFGQTVHGRLPIDSVRSESHTIAQKLMQAFTRRAAQADSVAAYIHKQQSKGHAVIVAGDLNDSPISYTRRTIAQGLTDCYEAAGHGPGYSYRRNGMRVRIDHIFCSTDYQPTHTQTDQTTSASDHYPIITYLKKRPKP